MREQTYLAQSRGQHRRRRLKPTALVALIALLCLLLACGVAWVVHKKQQQEYQRLLARYQQLSSIHQAASEQNISLEARLSDLDSDAYVEEMARKELGWVKENELVFVPGDEADAPTTASSSELGTQQSSEEEKG